MKRKCFKISRCEESGKLEGGRGHWVAFIERKVAKSTDLALQHLSCDSSASYCSSRLNLEDMTLLVSIPRNSAHIWIISVN
jgi:hypothetical protein